MNHLLFSYLDNGNPCYFLQTPTTIYVGKHTVMEAVLHSHTIAQFFDLKGTLSKFPERIVLASFTSVDDLTSNYPELFI